jgi:hypothetical protein
MTIDDRGRVSGAIELRESSALVGVGNDDEAPALSVRTGWSVNRQLEAVVDVGEVVRSLQVEASADGAGRAQNVLERGGRRTWS